MKDQSFYVLLGIVCLAMASCELLGSDKSGGLDGTDDETEQTIDECGPTDYLRPAWLDYPDTTGTLFYLTGMTFIPGVSNRDVVDSRPIMKDRLHFIFYTHYLRLDSTEARRIVPNFPNQDPQIGYVINPYDREPSVQFDKRFFYKKTEVPPGKNILDYATGTFQETGIIPIHNLWPLVEMSFIMDTSFVQFEPGCYIVRAGVKNEDGHEIWDTTRVYIDLE